MTIVLLFVASFMVFVSALEQPGGLDPRDIIRRMDELVGYNQRQQAELNELRNQNNAMKSDVARLQERDVELTNRVSILEETERSLQKSQEELGKQNEILVTDVNRVKENNNELVNRIAILEDEERFMVETIAALVKHVDNAGDIGTMESTPEPKENGATGSSMMDSGPKLDSVETGDTTGKERIRPSVAHNRVRQADQEMPVAFFATMTNFTSHVGHYQSIVFDNAITNIGNAYHPTSGYFYAPVSGIYVFSTTMLIYQQAAHFEYAVNGQVMSKMYTALGNAHETTSQTAVFNLSQGDEVVVRNVDTDITIHGDHYCSMSGFLLTTISDDTNAQIVG